MLTLHCAPLFCHLRLSIDACSEEFEHKWPSGGSQIVVHILHDNTHISKGQLLGLRYMVKECACILCRVRDLAASDHNFTLVNRTSGMGLVSFVVNLVRIVCERPAQGRRESRIY